jgi:RHS repeat-associated protein
VRSLTNSAGSVTDTFTYDAFGVLIARTGTTPNLYLYAGEQYDPDLGLYYNRARYLNTWTGRFWTQDSYEGASSDPQSLHKYLYANDNPANLFDPSGSFSVGETMQTVSLGLIIASAVFGITNEVRYSRYFKGPRAEVTDQPVIIEDSGWSVDAVENSVRLAAGIWESQAGIEVKTLPVKTIKAPKYLNYTVNKYTPDEIAASRLDGLLDAINSSTNHITVFTASTGISAGWSLKGGVPQRAGSKYGGVGLSVISGTIFHPTFYVVAHEWGHTFSLDDQLGVPLVGEFLPNLMGSVFTVPGLTMKQAREAHEYAKSHY